MNLIISLRNHLRIIVISVQHTFYTKILGMDISYSARVSFGAKLDKTNPKGIHIGEESYIASGAIVFTHDFSKGKYFDTHIGRKCFIGANSLIMGGVHISDNVIVGAGSIVTKDVPSNCIVAGNPARVIRKGISTIKYGQIVNANFN